ncbi:DUF3048 domain-containing protein [Patescibacteria group bacterium]|nr:DUF3048 domain-containing protein [Patescibacteria group bacterium]
MHDDIRSNPVVSPVGRQPDRVYPETNFRTPDQVAASDDNANRADVDAEPSTRNHFAHEPLLGRLALINTKKHKFWRVSKKQTWILTGVALVVVIAAGGGLVYLAHSHKPLTVNIPTVTKPKAKPQTINTVSSTLTGLPIPPSLNNRPITAVMIENTPPARPQSGLSQAGVVFEALTEGGISRFMALYQDQLPTYIGPVRSARPYFIDWELGFNAPYVHAGGSPQALNDINTENVRNIDLLDYSNYATRISSRPAPHNLYTNLQNILKLEYSLGWTTSSFSGWPRKADAPAKQPNVTNINFNISYSTYNVHYSYNPVTDSYNRSEGGAPQIDANTNEQLSPKVVIGMVVPWSQGSLDSSNAYYSVYQDIGSGEALVFQDGSVTIGQWNKPSIDAPLEFTLASSGQPLKLNAGQVWITALASAKEASYN